MIVHHATSGETLAPSADPETTSHTIGSTLTSGYVVVCLNGWGAAAAGDPAVTFDGTSVPLLAGLDRSAFGSAYFVRLYGLAVGAKANGTYTVSVNLPGSGGAQEYDIAILSYNGVHQSNTFAVATAQGNSTAPSVNVSSAAGETVVDAATFGGNQSAMGGGQTERRLHATPTGQGVSEEAGATTVTMSWTQSLADWVTAAVALQPAPDPSVDQEGYRFYTDAASPVALAAQDTGVTAPADVNTLIRVLLNGTLDPAAAQHQLEYRVNGGPWRKAEPPA